MLNRRDVLELLASAAVLPALQLTGCAHTTESAPASMPNGPARNPFLAADSYAMAHINPGQTDVLPYPALRGTFHVDPQTTLRVVNGPINIFTLASTSPDFMWGASSQGVTYVDVSNNGFREVARLNTPGVKVISPETHREALGQTFTTLSQVEKAVKDVYGLDWTRIANGVYSVVDRDNRVYYNTFAGQVFIFALKNPSNPTEGIEIVGSRDFTKGVLHEKEGIVGVTMTYDGNLVVMGNNSVSVIDRNLDGDVSTIRFAPDEYASNSAAVDEKNGIYFASDKIMRKLVWTGSKLSDAEADGAWAAPYDSGREPPAVKFGIGTGSTPSLMGFGNDPDKLVVLTDGADQMNLVAFWRDQVPAGFQQLPGTKSNKIAGQIAVTCGFSSLPEFIQTEQSVVAKDYGAFVVNNIRDGAKDRLIDVLAGGPVFAPPAGAERFEWDPKGHTWRSAWVRNDVVSTSMAPTVSGPSGVVFVNGYTKKDGWEMTGMDWATGETVHRTIFGQDNLGNGAYAQPQLFPNGDLLFNSIGGPMRVKLA